MTNIKYDQLDTYNDIIRENRRGTKTLEKEDNFPIAVLDFVFNPLSKNNYANLVDWSGEQNAMYLTERINNFDKTWLVFNNDKLNKYSIISQNKSGKLILEIADCFEPLKIEIDTMRFFNRLEKEPCYQDLQIIGNMKGYGNQKIPYTIFNKDSFQTIELNIMGNWATIRNRQGN